MKNKENEYYNKFKNYILKENTLNSLQSIVLSEEEKLQLENEGILTLKKFEEFLKLKEINNYIIKKEEFEDAFLEEENFKIDEKEDYIFLYNEKNAWMIPVKKHNSKKSAFLKEIIKVNDKLVSTCDGCGKKGINALFFKLYPEINIGLDKLYEDFKGTVCSSCINKMEKGLPLKEESDNKISEINETIDEFSDINDILKFCSIESEEELAEIIRKNIEDSDIE